MNQSPVKLSHIRIAAAIVILTYSCGGRDSRSMSPAAPLESYIEAELLRLEATYRILDRYSEALWPGWRNYADISVQVDFPNGVVLLVTPRTGSQPGFERLNGRTILGKAVFINRQDRTAAEVRPPLFARRAGGGLRLQLEMEQVDLPPLESERPAALEALLKQKLRPDAPFDLAPLGDSDSHILMYIHEHFHGYQARFRPFGPGEDGLRDFRIDAEYAAWSHIEGLALRRAYIEADDAASREFLKDFVVAREIKRDRMPAEAAAAEAHVSVAEGTPSYVSLKTALLLKGSDDKPGSDRAKDLYFYNFAYADGYVDNIMRKGMDFAVTLTQDKRGKYYLYGAYQCFLLDRFAPGWKVGFFEKKRNLDAVTADFLNLKSAEKAEIRRRLPSRYGYDEILSFHENALKKRSP